MTRQQRRALLGALVGALLGLAIGAGSYLALVPLLELADSPVRELQGFTWNLVPFGTIAGAVLGWVVARRSGPPGGSR